MNNNVALQAYLHQQAIQQTSSMPNTNGLTAAQFPSANMFQGPNAGFQGNPQAQAIYNMFQQPQQAASQSDPMAAMRILMAQNNQRNAAMPQNPFPDLNALTAMQANTAQGQQQPHSRQSSANSQPNPQMNMDRRQAVAGLGGQNMPTNISNATLLSMYQQFSQANATAGIQQQQQILPSQHQMNQPQAQPQAMQQVNNGQFAPIPATTLGEYYKLQASVSQLQFEIKVLSGALAEGMSKAFQWQANNRHIQLQRHPLSAEERQHYAREYQAVKERGETLVRQMQAYHLQFGPQEHFQAQIAKTKLAQPARAQQAQQNQQQQNDRISTPPVNNQSLPQTAPAPQQQQRQTVPLTSEQIAYLSKKVFPAPDFYNTLHQYLISMQMPNVPNLPAGQFPMIDQRQLNLHQTFTHSISVGGADQISQKLQWPQIARALGFTKDGDDPAMQTNMGNNIARVYYHYVVAFERGWIEAMLKKMPTQIPQGQIQAFIQPLSSQQSQQSQQQNNPQHQNQNQLLAAQQSMQHLFQASAAPPQQPQNQQNQQNSLKRHSLGATAEEEAYIAAIEQQATAIRANRPHLQNLTDEAKGEIIQLCQNSRQLILDVRDALPLIQRTIPTLSRVEPKTILLIMNSYIGLKEAVQMCPQGIFTYGLDDLKAMHKNVDHANTLIRKILHGLQQQQQQQQQQQIQPVPNMPPTKESVDGFSRDALKAGLRPGLKREDLRPPPPSRHARTTSGLAGSPNTNPSPSPSAESPAKTPAADLIEPANAASPFKAPPSPDKYAARKVAKIKPTMKRATSNNPAPTSEDVIRANGIRTGLVAPAEDPAAKRRRETAEAQNDPALFLENSYAALQSILAKPTVGGSSNTASELLNTDLFAAFGYNPEPALPPIVRDPLEISFLTPAPGFDLKMSTINSIQNPTKAVMTDIDWTFLDNYTKAMDEATAASTPDVSSTVQSSPESIDILSTPVSLVKELKAEQISVIDGVKRKHGEEDALSPLEGGFDIDKLFRDVQWSFAHA